MKDGNIEARGDEVIDIKTGYVGLTIIQLCSGKI